MKAVLYYAPGEIRLVDVPVPSPGPGEVLLKVGAALTCGTDFKAYRQGHRLLLGRVPSPFGHELAGTVVEAGPGAEAFAPGTRVVAANSAPCGDCRFCRREEPQLCDGLLLHNGAYAEYHLVPSGIVRRNLYKLEEGVDFRTAALSEPLACALHAVAAMRVRPGETVAILGAGTMSLLLTQALARLQARVLVVGRDRERLKTALRAGAVQTLSVLDDDPAGGTRGWSDGLGADCVFEAVGTPQTWRQAVAMARKGGRICLFGGCAPGSSAPLDAHRVHYDQLTLQGTFHHTPEYFRRALEMLSRGEVLPDLLISGQIPLSEVPAYFERMSDRSAPKVAVIP